MELIKLKRINNGNPKDGDLPGFADGLSSRQMSNIQQMSQFAQNNWVPGTNNTNNYSLNGVGFVDTRIPQNTNFAYNKNTITSVPSTGLTNLPSVTGKSSGPSQADSAAAGAGPWFAIGSWLGGGVLEGLNRIQTADQLLADAGTQQANIGGINYTRQNVVDSGKIMTDYDRSTASDWLTNPARALTGIFGRSKAKREAELAQMRSVDTANAQQASALTKSIRLSNAKAYGNTAGQQLYAAKDGLPTFMNSLNKYTKDNRFLYTSTGTAFGPANAKGEAHEVIVGTDGHGNATSMSEIAPQGKMYSGDIYNLQVKDTDGILSQRHIDPFTNKTYAQAAIDGDDAPMNLLDRQALFVNSKDRKYAKHGRLPKFSEGWWNSAIPASIGILGSFDQAIQALRNKPFKPNTDVRNPYELDALTTLAGLRVNPYPIIQQMRNAESRTNRMLDRSGGLSVAQRSLGRLSALTSTQRNIADALSNIQMQNNNYFNDYAKTALSTGIANAQRTMQANQWDLDYYSKAHAARQKGLQMANYNMINQANNYIAQDFKRRQFNDIMSLYKADQEQQKREIEVMNKYNNQLANLYKQQLPGWDYDSWKRLGKERGWV